MSLKRLSTFAAAAGCGLLLAGCELLYPKPAPIATSIPAPPAAAPAVTQATEPGPPAAPSAKARCVPRTFPKAPKYPDSDAALRDAGGAADRYQLMAAGRILRMLRLAELEKVIEACR